MPIPTNIKNIRELRSYTQAYMATKLGISQESYSKLESGKIKVDDERLIQIANVLEVQVETLKSFDVKFIFTNTFHGTEVGLNNQGITLLEKDFYEQIIKAKDAEIAFLKSKLSILEIANKQLLL